MLTNLLDFGLGGMRIGLLDANLASSWSHRATAATLLLGGGLAALRAGRAVRMRRAWGGTAAALILLFVIEISPAHVEVDRLSYGKLLYVPLLACLVICVLRLLDRSDRMIVARVGLASLAASYAVHILGAPLVRVLGWGIDSWAYQVKVGLKEGLELSGWLLLVWALWRGRTPPAGIGDRLAAGIGDRLAAGIGDRPAAGIGDRPAAGIGDRARPRSEHASADRVPLAPRPPVRRRAEASPMGCSQSGQG